MEGGVVTEVHGPHEALAPAVDAFEGGEFARIKITGICNSADRATLILVVKLESVLSMTLYRDQ